MKFNGKVYDEIFHPADEQNTAQVQGHLRKPEPKEQEAPEKQEAPEAPETPEEPEKPETPEEPETPETPEDDNDNV